MKWEPNFTHECAMSQVDQAHKAKRDGLHGLERLFYKDALSLEILAANTEKWKFRKRLLQHSANEIAKLIGEPLPFTRESEGE